MCYLREEETIGDNILNLLKGVAALIGGAVSYILGGFDNMLFILVILSVIDYISGILAAAYLQKVDSQIGYKGILKKIGIYCVVAVANLLDMAMGTDLIRGAAIGFYMAMEGISILENMGRMGLMIPQKVSDMLVQLQGKEK